MKPNALRFGAVGTLPLISAGKPIPGGGQVPDSVQELSDLMAIFYPSCSSCQDQAARECRTLRLTQHRA